MMTRIDMIVCLVQSSEPRAVVLPTAGMELPGAGCDVTGRCSKPRSA